MKFLKKIKASQIIRIFIILFVIIVAKSSSNMIETKLTNNASYRSIDLSTMAMKLEEDIKNDIYSAKDTYTGNLTGYTFDCPLCGGTLACASGYNVRDGKDYYIDPTYGTVKIVASSKNLPCGSVVRFQVNSISSEPIIAIVLDRGVTGNNLDLLSPTEEYARKKIGRKSITYDILRQGWNF